MPLTTLSRVEVVPTGAAVGAEVRGIDFSDMDESAFAALKSALDKHLIVLIRDQPLSDDDLVALGRRFGPLEPPGTSIIGKPFIEGYPDILVISNLLDNAGVPMGNLGAGEATWHTDISYREKPVSVAILHSLEIPPAGGNTYFANQYMAYEMLPADIKARIDGRLLVHDETYNSAGQIRKGFADVTDPRQTPGACHPIVRTHPDTGRKCLYLGRRRNGYIVGLPLEESEELLDLLWAHATQELFTWGHVWHTGDTLIRDNRCLLHRRDSFDTNARRMMHRVQIEGERPV
jgi:taurine dioxygenase